MRCRVVFLLAACAASAVPVFAAAPAPARIIYAGGDRSAPYQSMGADGEPQGFVIELMRALSREAGLDLTIRLGSWQETVYRLDAGEADVTAIALSKTRSNRYVHVVPVWHLRQVAIYRGTRPQPLRSLEDLAHDVVVVSVPSALHDDLVALDPSVRPTIIAARGAREAMETLAAGRATVAVGNAYTFDSLRRQLPSDLTRVELRSIPYSLVVRRGREDLIPVLVDAYSRLHDSGELSAIVERTLLLGAPETVVGRWSIYLFGLVGIGAVSLLVVATWNRTLRSQVDARTTDFKAVVERLEFHGLVQSQLTEAIIVVNADRHVTMWNAGAEAVFGVTAAEALGQPVHTIVQPLQDLDLDKVRATVLRDGVWRGEGQIRRRDGSPLHVEAVVKTLLDSNGMSEGRLIVVHDIDARKRAENELRAALALHRATLDSTAEGIMAVDVQGRIASFNQRFVDIWRVPPEIMASGNFVTVAEWAARNVLDGPAPMQTFYRALTADGVDTATLRFKDGRVIERYSLPQRLDGAIVGRVWSYRDVTERVHADEERRRLEHQMQHMQKLESLGVLAGGIAHDFNNLLVGMMGHAGLALMDLPNDSPVRQRIEQIETCAVRASELTNQMLAYSGKGRFVVQPTDLTAVVREMTNLLQTAVSKSARLELNLATELPAVSADVAQLRQVVMNLITNASDAIGDRPGRIAVSTGVMQASREYLAESFVTSAAEPGSYVFIEVRDDGCGMDAETRNRIFEPFFTTKFTGRGLGLAAVLGIVRGHQGAVRIDSTPGKGTTFRVLFPASGAPVVASVRAAGKARAARQARVLVVDDEPAVRMIAREALVRAGFTVVIARDGEEAIERVRAESTAIDAVLLDMTMPGINGVDALRAIHRIIPSVPVVLTSGYSEQEAADRCNGEVMAGFIQKPFAPTALVAKINDALSVGAHG